MTGGGGKPNSHGRSRAATAELAPGQWAFGTHERAADDADGGALRGGQAHAGRTRRQLSSPDEDREDMTVQTTDESDSGLKALASEVSSQRKLGVLRRGSISRCRAAQGPSAGRGRGMYRLLFPLALAACGGGVENEWVDLTGASTADDVPSWEEFLAASTFESADGPRYLVEEDVPVFSVEELREYYDERYTGDADKLAVRTIASGDDAWSNMDQRRLEYCVSTSFPATGTWSRTAVIAGMATATTRWQQQGNVMFTYVPTRDANCTLADAAPHDQFIKVTPVSIALAVACAFYPVSRFTCPELDEDPDPAVVAGSTLGIDTADAPPISVARTLTHELGHHLGMIHEYQRSDTPGGACPTSDSSRFLTSYDVGSIMQASQGGCGSSPTENLTAVDGLGIRAKYGAPAGWFPSYNYQFFL